jgi:hypothetical protein
MIINEKLLDPVFDGGETINLLARGATYVLAIAGVLGTGWLATRKQVQEESETQSI